MRQKLTPEELAQLNMIYDTLREMHNEVREMNKDNETWEASTWIAYTSVKVLTILARHGVNHGHPPTLPDKKLPF